MAIDVPEEKKEQEKEKEEEKKESVASQEKPPPSASAPSADDLPILELDPGVGSKVRSYISFGAHKLTLTP